MRRRKKKGIREAVTELARERLQDGQIKEGKTCIVRVPFKRGGGLDVKRAEMQEVTAHEHTDQLS